MESNNLGASHEFPSFEKFLNLFLTDLQSPTFGAEPHSQQPGTRSPAAKELDRNGVRDVFTRSYLKSVYNLLNEHARLKREQGRIHNLTRQNSRKLVKLRNAIRTVTSAKGRFKTVEKNTQGIVDPAVWERVQRVLSDCEAEMQSCEEYLASMLHPAERRSYASKVRWEPILKLYDYKLQALKKKAPDQWLYGTLNNRLVKKLAKLKISDMTRYRIMSAVLLTCGIDVKPTTFKLCFRIAKRKPAVKKTRPT
jgi:hypothetical protein